MIIGKEVRINRAKKFKIEQYPRVLVTVEETDFFADKTKHAYNFGLRLSNNADINAIRYL